MKIGIIGISHTFQSQYKALKELGYDMVLCDIDKAKLQNFKEEKVENYKSLIGKVEVVLIATPPKEHFKIVKFFLEKKIKVICEKPLVTKISELKELKQLINNNFYNILHFAYGEEINWFINNYNKKRPKKIKVYINDPYMKNKHITKEGISLGGAYLDEVINPLSALVRIYGNNLNFEDKHNIIDNFCLLDYVSKSHFKIDDIPIEINVVWNDFGNKEKYMDLYFTTEIIRLDSYNVQVLNLTTKKVLFKSWQNRMDRHYLNGLKSCCFENEVSNLSLKLNEIILKGKEE